MFAWDILDASSDNIGRVRETKHTLAHLCVPNSNKKPIEIPEKQQKRKHTFTFT